MAESQSWWRGENSPKYPSSEQESFETTPLELSDNAPTEHLPTRRIHIMGLGSIGTFIAHCLKTVPNPPPISLLLHRDEMYADFKQKNRVVRLINKKVNINDEQTGYDIDILEHDPETESVRWKHIPDKRSTYGKETNPRVSEEILDSGETYIHCLIVTVKGPATVKALLSIRHRVNASSTICLIQNGMGQVDELNREVFPDPVSRPTYLLGVISHGVHLASDFVAIHAGMGTTALGIVRDFDKFPRPPKSTSASEFEPSSLSDADRKRHYPSDEDLYTNISSRYLLRTLTRSPTLTCAPYPYLDLLALQLEKLAMNCVLNPLTALLDIPNGAVLHNDPLTRTSRLLLAEISLVFRSLPELAAIPTTHMRFSPERLETLYLGVAVKTAENSSSMREDLRKRRGVEVEYINGYVVKRGEELGVKCVLNYMVMCLVLGKSVAMRGGRWEPYGTVDVKGEKVDGGRSGEVVLEDRGTVGKGRV